MTFEENDNFTPALGKHWLTPFYDFSVALTTRERTWRKALVQLIEPRPFENIVDIGCGTATLDIAVALKEPKSQITGIDPDPAILSIARHKVLKAGVGVSFVQDYGDTLCRYFDKNTIDKVFSGLMLHHVNVQTKRAIIQAAFDVLKPGGSLFVADFGEQRTPIARALFKTIQRLDGYETTQPNADGILPVLMEASGFEKTLEPQIFMTPVGSISLYVAQKA
jgi:ubiquinone/menaquinone biosynthesis C-methylase UbiE